MSPILACAMPSAFESRPWNGLLVGASIRTEASSENPQCTRRFSALVSSVVVVEKRPPRPLRRKREVGMSAKEKEDLVEHALMLCGPWWTLVDL
jgi:hypothetical protein